MRGNILESENFSAEKCSATIEGKEHTSIDWMSADPSIPSGNDHEEYDEVMKCMQILCFETKQDSKRIRQAFFKFDASLFFLL
jgi:hypothetical protein